MHNNACLGAGLVLFKPKYGILFHVRLAPRPRSGRSVELRCAARRALTIAEDGVGEFRDRIQSRLWRLAMRRMPRPWNSHHVDRAIAFVLRDLDLTHAPVLIIDTLHDHDGDPDIGEVFRNIPVAELRVEPSAVPAVKGVVDVAMPARQFCPEVGGLEGLFYRGD